MVVLFCIDGQQTHEMQGVRMIGFECQSLLAAKLGVEILLFSQIAEAGLTERSDGSRPGRADSGYPGGGPALATAHRRIPKIASLFCKL
jgi:hypothetical protein